MYPIYPSVLTTILRCLTGPGDNSATTKEVTYMPMYLISSRDWTTHRNNGWNHIDPASHGSSAHWDRLIAFWAIAIPCSAGGSGRLLITKSASTLNYTRQLSIKRLSPGGDKMIGWPQFTFYTLLQQGFSAAWFKYLSFSMKKIQLHRLTFYLSLSRLSGWTFVKLMVSMYLYVFED